MRRLFVLLLTVLLPLQANASTVEVHDFKILPGLPSASATTYVDDLLYVVGDDSPSLYALDQNHSIIQETDIQNGKPGEDGRIPGREKADLEAASLFSIDGAQTLIMVGSGTYTPKRENALLFSVREKNVTWKNVTPLYKRLRTVAGLNDNEFINIEGLAHNGITVFMLSRGSRGPNLIFTFQLTDFINYMTDKTDNIENISVKKLYLPGVAAMESTLSGATWHAPSNKLIITTSLESDDDGKILGSFLSFVTAEELKEKQHIDLTKRAYRLYKDGKPITSKIESVSITNTENDKISGVLVADNDDGTSQIMRFDLRGSEKN